MCCYCKTNKVIDFVLSDDGTTVTYSGNGLPPRTETVEAFFNDITNALATKDKGTTAQKAIDDAKNKKAKSYKLGNKTFTQEQVEKAAKASGLSVADYIKQAGLQ